MGLRGAAHRWRWSGVVAVGVALLLGLWLASGIFGTSRGASGPCQDALLPPAVEAFPSGSVAPRSPTTSGGAAPDDPSIIAWQTETQRFYERTSAACGVPMPRLLCSGSDCVVLHTWGGRWSWLSRIIRQPSVVAEALAQRWAPSLTRCQRAFSEPPFGRHDVSLGPWRDGQICSAIYSRSAAAGSVDRARAMCKVAVDLPTMPPTR